MVIQLQRLFMMLGMTTVFATGIILVACESAINTPFEEEDNAQLVWPLPPNKPRITFVKSFSRPEDLGIRKSFAERLSELIVGPSEIQLVRPMAIAVTPSGIVYVADPGIQGVHRFDINSGHYHLVQREQEQPLPSPVGLAVGLTDEVYVTDSRLARLYRIEPGATEAHVVPLQGLLAQPTGIALDPTSGRLYLVDTGSHNIKVFARDGSLLKTIGQRGTGAGEFNFPTMIWLDNQGRLLVSDSMNFRVQIFDTKGKFKNQFGEVGDGTGHHAQPKGIAADQEGHIYVVDSIFHTIQLFDPMGTFLLNVGQQGQARGEFWLPTGIFIGEHDTIYIADSYNRRVQVFRYLGETP